MPVEPGANDQIHTSNPLPDRSFKTGFIVLLALNVFLRLWLVLQPLEYLDGLSIPDDTYISLTLARNVAHGSGPAFAGEPTSGFQPLFVFLMVPVFLLASHDAVLPVHIASGLSSIFDTMTLFVLCMIVARRSKSPLVMYPVALAWILNPVGIRTATNGMETSMACFILTWGLSMIDSKLGGPQTSGSWRVGLPIGLVVGLGMIARIDTFFLGVTAVSTLLIVGRDDLRTAFQNALGVVSGSLIIYLPWMAYSFWSTGDLYPVSGKAIRLMSLATVDFAPTLRNWYALILGEGLAAVWRINRTVLVADVAALVSLLLVVRGSARKLRGRFAWLWPAVVFSLLLFAAYTLYVFGPWFFNRYLYPTAIVFLLILAALVDSLLEKLPGELHRRVAITIIAALVVSLNLTDPEFRRTFARSETSSPGYMNIGLWAKETFAPGTVIGSAQSGALAYFADGLTIINLDGVVSKSCYESLLHFKSMSYLRERHVEYVVGWYSNFQYLEHQSEGLRPGDLSPLRKIEGIQSWGYDWYVARVFY